MLVSVTVSESGSCSKVSKIGGVIGVTPGEFNMGEDVCSTCRDKRKRSKIY